METFEYIEMFFRRLEVFTEVRPTEKMMDIIIQIMVEVLSFLGIALKKIKQGRIGGHFGTSMRPMTETMFRKILEQAI